MIETCAGERFPARMSDDGRSGPMMASRPRSSSVSRVWVRARPQVRRVVGALHPVAADRRPHAAGARVRHGLPQLRARRQESDGAARRARRRRRVHGRARARVRGGIWPRGHLPPLVRLPYGLRRSDDHVGRLERCGVVLPRARCCSALSLALLLRELFSRSSRALVALFEHLFFLLFLLFLLLLLRRLLLLVALSSSYCV